ncbi:hypothetical protein EKD04_021915 [Chloroflexales bacterium ZM16-3]|nr:hypothetical protein [Chloroflexales bacterium ZM16-3]
MPLDMGSVYRPETGTGIAWQPGQAQLWQGGKVIAQAMQCHSFAVGVLARPPLRDALCLGLGLKQPVVA